MPKTKTNCAISGPVGPENQSEPTGGSGPVGPPDQPNGSQEITETEQNTDTKPLQ